MAKRVTSLKEEGAYQDAIKRYLEARLDCLLIAAVLAPQSNIPCISSSTYTDSGVVLGEAIRNIAKCRVGICLVIASIKDITG